MTGSSTSKRQGRVYGNRLADTMAAGFYDAAFLLFAVFYLPVFFIKARQADSAKNLIRERLGLLPNSWAQKFQNKKVVWIHAVSVGEVMAIRKFLEHFRIQFPEMQLILTTVTPTGQAIAKKLERDNLFVCYYPFDLSFAVRNFFRTFQPLAVLLVETEIWPNLVMESVRRNVPVGVLNARLSVKSFGRYRCFRFLLGPLFRSLAFVLAQNEGDGLRFSAMGVASAKVAVMGNMKFDNVSFDTVSFETKTEQKARCGFKETDLVLVAGSTHPGEEEKLLKAFLQLRSRYAALKLILAPRHIERSESIKSLVVRSGFRCELLSYLKSGRVFDVLILDQMGLLNKIYAVAVAAFLGGSWIRHGGQNPIEPASMKCPVLHGPYVFNFEKIYQTLDESGGALLVQGEKALEEAMVKLLEDQATRTAMGERAYRAVEQLRGATQKHLKWLQGFMNQALEERTNHVVFDEKLFPASCGRK
jgi:3-deoxy-D-manno-octulosonic-acid transferase